MSNKDERRNSDAEIYAAMVTIAGAFALVLFGLIANRFASQDPKFLVWFVIVAGTLTIFGGILIGHLAQQLFGRSTIPPKLAAIVMALVLDFAIFGWILVLTL